MQTLCKFVGRIPQFRSNVTPSVLVHEIRANYATKISPVHLSCDILTQNTSNNLPPLIIMHGLLGSKRNWKTVSKYLGMATCRDIYVVDARNHGESPHDAHHSTAHMTEDVALLMRENDVKQASLIGHSMGGRTMMHFALNYPQMVEKAVIVDISPISLPENFDEMSDILSALKSATAPKDMPLSKARAEVSKQIQEVVSDKEILDFILMNLKKNDAGEFEWAMNVDSLQRNLSDLRDSSIFHRPPFKGPVLFICGRRSSYLNPDDWKKIKKIFPNARLEWVDSGHLVHFEQPQMFVSLVSNFLKS